jgi:EmrB/QacA subfamily drug resistance transporter
VLIAEEAEERLGDEEAAFISTRRGALTLVLLCSVQFLDLLDASIVNVALPSIRRDLDFSEQTLQWVLSGYLLTYGGFLLLGGRAADLLGRRRIVVAGTTVFGISSLVGGLATSAGTLVAARLVQGVGAAMMTPAALSILTTTFREGRDRNKALGAWGAMAGLSSAAGVLFGGLLADGPGWRWVLLVNVPVCIVVIVGSFRLFSGERRTAQLSNFDSLGAVLGTGGMLLLVYAIVEAPNVGWGATRTIAGLAGAAVVLAAFAINELRSPNPLFPFSIFRIKGVAAADATQLIALAGFYSTFFFVTLYMQNVLGYSPIEAGVAYLPATVAVAAAAALSSQLFARTGTRPVIVAGALLGAAGIFHVSRIPVDGSYVSDLLPGLLVMSVGLGAVFVGVITAANAGVPPDKAGLAASLISASQQLGAALGLAIFTAIATSRTSDLLGSASPPDQLAALTSGYRYALTASAAFVLGAAVIATRAGEMPPRSNDRNGSAVSVPSRNQRSAEDVA